MTIEKSQKINDLLDTYGPLLTEKQQLIMDYYFIYDLSFAEIAENTNTTRAAVFDLIKRTIKILEKYEAKLNLLEKKEKLEKIIEDLDENTKKEIEQLL